MKNIKALVNWLVKDESGGETVEYPAIIAGIVLIGIPTILLIGTAIGALYDRINAAIGTI